MPGKKAAPVWVLKGCLIILISAFLFTFVTSVFNPRVQASGIIESGAPSITNSVANSDAQSVMDLQALMGRITRNTGIYSFVTSMRTGVCPLGRPCNVCGWQELYMVLLGFLLVYLGAKKGLEPVFLVPIGFGVIFANIPFANMGADQGFLSVIFNAGIGNAFFPLVILICLGASSDFSSLIANPKNAIPGITAQLGVFAALSLASIANIIPGVSFNIREAAVVSIIGSAAGPAAIFTASRLSPHILPTVALAAFFYMALAPKIQRPVTMLLTNKEERLIKMKAPRHVSRAEKVAFPLFCFALTILFFPAAAPLIGCLMFGNFIRETGITQKLSNSAQNELMNIVTMFLALGIGSRITPEVFLNPTALAIVLVGLIAFCLTCAGGILGAKFMNLWLNEKINPLIGSAGVSVMPQAAAVSDQIAQEEDPGNPILNHALGTNAAGLIATAIVAGLMIAVFG